MILRLDFCSCPHITNTNGKLYLVICLVVTNLEIMASHIPASMCIRILLYFLLNTCHVSFIWKDSIFGPESKMGKLYICSCKFSPFCLLGLRNMTNNICDEEKRFLCLRHRYDSLLRQISASILQSLRFFVYLCRLAFARYRANPMNIVVMM